MSLSLSLILSYIVNCFVYIHILYILYIFIEQAARSAFCNLSVLYTTHTHTHSHIYKHNWYFSPYIIYIYINIYDLWHGRPKEKPTPPQLSQPIYIYLYIFDFLFELFCVCISKKVPFCLFVFYSFIFLLLFLLFCPKGWKTKLNPPTRSSVHPTRRLWYVPKKNRLP